MEGLQGSSNTRSYDNSTVGRGLSYLQGRNPAADEHSCPCLLINNLQDLSQAACEVEGRSRPYERPVPACCQLVKAGQESVQVREV